ncbi:hypothetical protein [Paenibacillus radicis (ex Gao et al. 2016)]|uniref:hypothetical protein n=1 Tax=Paenibacillus radicis (ex Gao et al. 2016) TaxID=1737354 RepID=UPI00166AAA72|nr:hypothetical protein [Paenibacillus radicis (ex Gao et al. 2016)]
MKRGLFYLVVSMIFLLLINSNSAFAFKSEDNYSGEKDSSTKATVDKTPSFQDDESFKENYQKLLKNLKERAAAEGNNKLEKIVDENLRKTNISENNEISKGENEQTIDSMINVGPSSNLVTNESSAIRYYLERQLEEVVYVNAGEKIEIFQKNIYNDPEGADAFILCMTDKEFHTGANNFVLVETKVKNGYIEFLMQTDSNTTPGVYYLYYPTVAGQFQAFQVIPSNLQEITFNKDANYTVNLSFGNYKLYSFNPDKNGIYTFVHDNPNLWIGVFEDTSFKNPVMVNKYMMSNKASQVNLVPGKKYYILLYPYNTVGILTSKLSMTYEIKSANKVQYTYSKSGRLEKIEITSGANTYTKYFYYDKNGNLIEVKVVKK